jgi:zinc transport system substrate-binding protein
MEKSLSSLASSATKIELMDVDGTTLYDFREGATFEAHEHHDEHEEEHHDEHKHHDDHDDDYDDEHHDEHEHHGEHDPHVWLDPQNAQVWINEIAKSLSNADSHNAQRYQDNAKSAIKQLKQLTAEIEDQAHTLDGIKFIVFHDAYQYFEQRFGLLATGAISVSDAAKPSPARITEIQETVKNWVSLAYLLSLSITMNLYTVCLKVLRSPPLGLWTRLVPR